MANNETQAKIVLSAEDRTKAAFVSAQRNLEGLKGAADDLIGKFGSLGIAITGAFEAASFKEVIDVADQLGHLSQRSGIAVEDLSALRFAGKLADVSMEDLAVSLKRLNVNIAAAARGSGPQADAFTAIGVAVKDASGKVRSADLVFADIAEKFASYNDGPNKVAIANAIGGKSFEALIPILNRGKQGIAETKTELQQLGGVFTPEFAKQAEDFNNNLARIGTTGEALKIKLGGPLLGALNQLSEKFLEAKKNGTLLADVLHGLITFSPTRSLFGAIFGGADSANEKAAALEADAKRIKSAIASLEADVERNPNKPHAQQLLDGLRADLAAVQAQAQDASAALGEGKFRVPNLIGINARGPKVEAPALPGTGAADNALAALKKATEGRIQAIQASLANERDAYKFQDGFLKQIYDHAEISLQTFYQAQDETRRTALEATRVAVAKEITENEKLLSSPLLKAADREETKNKIAKARESLAIAEREADQAATSAIVERQRTTEALRDNVKSLEAQIATLQGDQSAAPLLDIATKVRDARRLLMQALPVGADQASVEPEVAQYKRLLEAQLQLNQARENFTLITARLAISEERIALAQQTGNLTENQALQAQGEGRRAVVAQLEAQLAAQTALAAGSKDPQVALAIERTRLELDKLKATLDPLKDKFDNLFKDAGSNALEALFNGTKSLRGALTDFGNSIVQSINHDIAKELSGAIFGKGGALGGAGSLFAGLFGGAKGAGVLSLDPAAAAAQATATAAITAAQASSAVAIATANTAAQTASTTAIVTAIGSSTAAIVAALGAVGAAGAAGSGLGAILPFAGLPGAAGEAAIGNLGADFVLPGLATGGFTGNLGANTPAGIVHGGEFVFSAPAVRSLGVQTLERMHGAARGLPGYQAGGYAGLRSANPAASSPSSKRTAGGGDVHLTANIAINSNGSLGSRDTQEQIAVRIARQMQAALARGTA